MDTIDVPTRARALGGNVDFVRFVTDELPPWTEVDGRTVVGGQSFGAIMALLAAHLAPGRFGHLLAQSPPLWRAPHLIDAYPPGRDVVDRTHALHDQLVHNAYRASLTEYTGGHEFHPLARPHG